MWERKNIKTSWFDKKKKEKQYKIMNGMQKARLMLLFIPSQGQRSTQSKDGKFKIGNKETLFLLVQTQFVHHDTGTEKIIQALSIIQFSLFI